MLREILVLAILCTCCHSRTSSAQEPLLVTRVNSADISFLPGDAFFHAILSRDHADLIAADCVSKFAYIVPDGCAALGWTAGYTHIQLLDQSKAFCVAVRNAYYLIRTRVPRLIVEHTDEPGEAMVQEVNPLRVLIYHKDADLSTQRIGIKYNSRWKLLTSPAVFVPTEAVSQRRVDASRYTTFVDSTLAAVEDWRFADTFPSLAVEPHPESPDPFAFGSPVKLPVTARASTIKLVILAGDNIAHYFNKRPGSWWAEVHSDSMVAVRYFDCSGDVITFGEFDGMNLLDVQVPEFECDDTGQ